MKTTLTDYLAAVLQRSLELWDMSRRTVWSDRRELISHGGVRPPTTGNTPTFRKRDQRTRDALADAGLLILSASVYSDDDKRTARVILTAKGATAAAKATGLVIPESLWRVIRANEARDLDAMRALLADPYQGDR